MSYSGLGLSVSGSVTIGTSGAKASGTASTSTTSSTPSCEGGDWWKCARLVRYFTSPTGGGISKLPIMMFGTWDKIQLAVIDGMQNLGMLTAANGWNNVKGEVRAMAWFLNRGRLPNNFDFDDALNKLTTTAAYAYDKALEEAQKAKESTSTYLTSAAAKALAPKIDFNAISKALLSVPAPKVAAAPVQTKAMVGTAPTHSSTAVIAVGVVAAVAIGGGIYLLSRKKAA